MSYLIGTDPAYLLDFVEIHKLVTSACRGAVVSKLPLSTDFDPYWVAHTCSLMSN